MKPKKVTDNLIFILSITAVIFLIFIMLGLLIFKEQVFIERERLSIPEYFIGFGFILVFVFNILSIIWLYRNSIISEKPVIRKILMIVLGLLCLLLMIGEKTMADEIGRETLIGWETTGEWIILYIFLSIQLVYNCLIINLFVRDT